MWYQIIDQLFELRDFIELGGWVLWVIAAVAGVMWTFILERIFYYNFSLSSEMKQLIRKFSARSDTSHYSWTAKRLRSQLCSTGRGQINRNLSIIATLIALCPLLGLLGTVTGMIEVFSVMAATGGSDAKLMAGGVSRATIPTLAGMVAAISGVLGNTYVTRIANRQVRQLESQLAEIS